MQAAILTGRRSKTEVSVSEIDDSVDRIVAGMEGTPMVDSKSKSLVAYHEVGHAVCGTLTPGNPRACCCKSCSFTACSWWCVSDYCQPLFDVCQPLFDVSHCCLLWCNMSSCCYKDTGNTDCSNLRQVNQQAATQ